MPESLGASVVVASSAASRRACALRWLAGRSTTEPVLVLGATRHAASQLLREAMDGRGASLGWHRHTPGSLAAALAAPSLAADGGVAPATGLALTAACLHALQEVRGELSWLGPVATYPGVPMALVATFSELGAEGIEPGDPHLSVDARSERLAAVLADVSRVYAGYRARLAASGIADRAATLRRAVSLAPALAHPLLGLPTLVLDVPAHGAAEAALLEAVLRRAPSALVTVAAGDRRTLANAARWGEAEAAPAEVGQSSLSRLQRGVFEPAAAHPVEADLDGSVVILSSHGESRECVEIARRIHQAAARGVPFDRMAILLRSPASYRGHLEEVLARAEVPAFFVQGTRRPDRAGRALAALLRCAAEGLSASRFAEYLSLGVVPDLDAHGAPPPAPPEASRWQPPDDALSASEEEEQAAAEVDEPPLSPDAPAPGGSLRAPRRWERLIMDASVIGGAREGTARWARRLDELRRALVAQAEAPPAATEDPEQALATRRTAEARVAEIDRLAAFALPVLGLLAALPVEASWGDWIDRLGALATRAIRKPERVIRVLAELAPMAPVGGVTLADVESALRPRLTELYVPSEATPAGQVFVAPVDAARGLSFEVVFVPGLAEKLFPRRVREDPLLPDALRQHVCPELEQNDGRAASERLQLRLAVGAATTQLVATYPRVDTERARPRVPSFYGLELLRAATGRVSGFAALRAAATTHDTAARRTGWPAPPDPALAVDAAEYDLAVLDGLFRRSGEDEITRGAVAYLLGESRHLARSLRFRARRYKPGAWTVADGFVRPEPLALAALMARHPTERPYAVTTLEKYATCPYRFYLAGVVGLRPLELPVPAERMPPAVRGRLIHDVLQGTLRRLRATDAAAPGETLDAVLDEVAANYADALAPPIERVWQDTVATLRSELRSWLTWYLASRWRNTHNELAFGLRPQPGDGRDAASTPLPVVLPGGLLLRGAIDAVDVRQGGGVQRATDFKSGQPRHLDDTGVTRIAGGELLQPIFYALALEALMPGVTVESGALVYCTVPGEPVELEIALDADSRAAAERVSLTILGAFDEAFFPARPAEGACERCDYLPVCGPREEARTASKPRMAALDRLRGER